MKWFMAVVSTLALIVWLVFVTVMSIQYNRSIGGHLKRAADANTVEIAQKELEVALANMEEQGMTRGYTSIIYETPDEDVGFWYENVKAAHAELDSLPESVTPLERSNMLMKLRETLTDNGERGTKVTQPKGIAKFPHNTLFAILGLLFLVFTAGGWLAVSLDL